MTPKRTLIRGGQVYDHEGDVHKPALADILIEDDKIHSVGANLAPEGAHEVIDASGRLVVPGLINAHYHSHDVLCRGLFEELPLEMWLLYTLPMGADRSKDEVRARTLVGALESLRCHEAGCGPSGQAAVVLVEVDADAGEAAPGVDDRGEGGRHARGKTAEEADVEGRRCPVGGQ